MQDMRCENVSKTQEKEEKGYSSELELLGLLPSVGRVPCNGCQGEKNSKTTGIYPTKMAI